MLAFEFLLSVSDTLFNICSSRKTALLLDRLQPLMFVAMLKYLEPKLFLFLLSPWVSATVINCGLRF
jgi:hypothetical protein